MTFVTRSIVSGPTRSARPLTTFDTVWADTPARSATSRIVTCGGSFLLWDLVIAPGLDRRWAHRAYRRGASRHPRGLIARTFSWHQRERSQPLIRKGRPAT